MPQSLTWLFETKQALEVIPDVLYFVSIGEKLPSVEEGLITSTTKKNSLLGTKLCQEKGNGATHAKHMEGAAATDVFKVFPKDKTSRLSLPFKVQEPEEEQHQIPWKDQSECDKRISSPQVLLCADTTPAHSPLLFQQLMRDCCNDRDIGAVMHGDAFFFSVSESPSFEYRPFFADFGPLDLNAVTRFSRCLQGLLECSAGYEWRPKDGGAAFGPCAGAAMDERGAVANGSLDRLQPSLEAAEADGGGKNPFWAVRSGADGKAETQAFPIVFCSRLDNHDRANAACLLACFCVATLRWSAVETWRMFQEAYPPIIPFRDASHGASAFPLTLLDVISGLEKAIALGWYDTQSFDVAEYDRLKKFDCSWIVPRVFLAFPSPDEEVRERSVKMYAKLLKQLHVTHVVRLSESMYNRKKFLANGVQHVELEFPDGISPNDDIVTRFMRVVEAVLLTSRSTKESSMLSTYSKNLIGYVSRTPSPQPNISPSITPRVPSRGKRRGTHHGGGGAIAVHCCSGLGRTGTLISVYMMQQYGMTARECIGWIRLCRPGSVIGVQQQFLETIERRLTRPTHCKDILRAEYHTRVIGSGVVEKCSRYAYQQHGLEAALAKRATSPLLDDSAAWSAEGQISATGTDSSSCVRQCSPHHSRPCTSSYLFALERWNPSRGASRLRSRVASSRPPAWRDEAAAAAAVASLTPPRLQALVRQWRHARALRGSPGVGHRGEDLAPVSAAVRLLPAPPAAARERDAAAGPGWGAPAVRIGAEQRGGGE